jgi:hypothetical protein
MTTAATTKKPTITQVDTINAPTFAVEVDGIRYGTLIHIQGYWSAWIRGTDGCDYYWQTFQNHDHAVKAIMGR